MMHSHVLRSSEEGNFDTNTTPPLPNDGAQLHCDDSSSWQQNSATSTMLNSRRESVDAAPRQEKGSSERARRRKRETREGEIVETDGTQYRRERDAPGQNCVYIAPGYHEREFYRLGTYAKFPSQVPCKVTDMAASGFYYTGYKDRVKCFSCGMAVENWTLGDDPLEPRWHKNDCKMPAAEDERNVAITAPNFRILFRTFMGRQPLQGIASRNLGHKNYAAATTVNVGNTAANIAVTSHSSRPVDITDVTTNFGQVQINDFPELKLANIQSTQHETFLKGLNLKLESERRKTFEHWPSYPAPHLVPDLAKEGFFYLGNLDRTQCFSCSGVLRNWSPSDDVIEEHRRNYPLCRVVRGMDAGNVPMTDNRRAEANEEYRRKLDGLLPSSNNSLVEPADPPAEDKAILAQYFPCNDAVNPHMRLLQTRLNTFDNRWNEDRIRATPQQIAKAGFFFLGDRDRTKCFYCNGGLQNWDPNDEPWTEHAKWFPGCEYVLRNKGVEFVRNIAMAHPNLNRPHIRNPASYDIPPPDTRRATNLTMESQMNLLDAAVVQGMGFSRENIENAIRRIFLKLRKLNDGGFANTQELIDYLLENNAENMEIAPTIVKEPAAVQAAAVGVKRNGSEQSNGNQMSKKTRISVGADVAGEELAESLREINETTLCKKCRKSKAEVVLIPCGHLAVCSNCAPEIKRCVVCDNKVDSFMKVFRV